LSVELDVPDDLRPAVAATLERVGVESGHVSVELVGTDRIRDLNRSRRGIDAATDVLAFPVDGRGESAGPRELGDVVICADEAPDVREAAVHGVLHLCGYDHERDDGEMLELQGRILAALER
jgi:probable rRNA maturation factor